MVLEGFVNVAFHIAILIEIYVLVKRETKMGNSGSYTLIFRQMVYFLCYEKGNMFVFRFRRTIVSQLSY